MLRGVRLLTTRRHPHGWRRHKRRRRDGGRCTCVPRFQGACVVACMRVCVWAGCLWASRCVCPRFMCAGSLHPHTHPPPQLLLNRPQIGFGLGVGLFVALCGVIGVVVCWCRLKRGAGAGGRGSAAGRGAATPAGTSAVATSTPTSGSDTGGGGGGGGDVEKGKGGKSGRGDRGGGGGGARASYDLSSEEGSGSGSGSDGSDNDIAAGARGGRGGDSETRALSGGSGGGGGRKGGRSSRGHRQGRRHHRDGDNGAGGGGGSGKPYEPMTLELARMGASAGAQPPAPVPSGGFLPPVGAASSSSAFVPPSGGGGLSFAGLTLSAGAGGSTFPAPSPPPPTAPAATSLPVPVPASTSAGNEAAFRAAIAAGPVVVAAPVRLRAKPTLKAAEFESKWSSLPHMELWGCTLAGNPAPEEMERLLAPHGIACMASGDKAGVLKYYFFAQPAPDAGLGDAALVIAEVSVTTASRRLSAVVKGSDAVLSTGCVEVLRQVLAAVTA